jgi:hypothetical protein
VWPLWPHPAVLAQLAPCLPLSQGVLFCLYGLILCECVSSEQVERHLACLLELSHQPSSQREVSRWLRPCFMLTPASHWPSALTYGEI